MRPLPFPDLKLLPGMTANITVMVKEVKDILKVPTTALRFTPPQEYLDEMMKNLPDSIKKKREKWAAQGGRGGSGGMSGGMPGTGGGMQGAPQGGTRSWGDRPRRSDFGMVWVKTGDSIKPRRVHTGLSDGLNTEVTGKINAGDEVITGSTSPTVAATGQQQQQQQNPFAPQMQRGGGGRGGR